MRNTMFLTLTLAAVALAGCSDEPPSGEFSSSGNDINVEGNYTAEFQAFNNPYENTDGTDLQCAQDGVPDPSSGMSPVDPCTYPYTKVNGHVMTLPAIGSSSYQAFFVDSSGTATNMEIGTSDAGNGMVNLEFDNESACADSTDDATCKLDEAYDTIEIHAMLSGGAVPVATSALSGAGSFEMHAGLGGVSYTASYDGKDLTVTVSGLDEESPLPVAGWLVTVEDGSKTHEVEVPLTGNGEQAVFTAPETIDSYQEFHIHVAGTSINLALGTIA